MEELIQAINQLRENPFFYFSLASKENFHSNFWEWLSKINPLLTLKLFNPNNNMEDEINFHREYRKNIPDTNKHVKVDMLIESDNNPYLIIENKIKDFATNEQLSRITNAFSEDNPNFILTTLFNFEGLAFNNWEIVTYEQISQRLNNLNLDEFVGEGNENFQYIIEYYRVFLTELVGLVNNLPITNNYDFIRDFNNNDDLFNLLDSVKMWEAYQRMRASHFIFSYTRPFENINTKVSINHKKATIDFEYTLNEDYSIGIQLEGKQFRWFIKGKNRTGFANNLRSNELFFNTEQDLLGYKPNFHYQYEIINENISYENLNNQINENLNWINENCEEILLNIPN